MTVLLPILMGMAGLAIDVGSWYRAHRALQAQADAAALAGAQELPDSTAGASSQAIAYATKNNYTLTSAGISFASVDQANDSITVKASDSAPTFFTKLFGLNSVSLKAQATAKTSLMGQARYVAPITVNIKHPLLSGSCPCFNQPTSIPLSRNGTPGAFGFLDLNNLQSNGASDLGAWILNGYNDALPVNTEYSLNTGAKFNSKEIESALDARIGTVLLFPVYDTIRRQGTIAEYHVIAWVGFRLTGYNAINGDTGDIYGSFTEVVWQGLPAAPNGHGASEPDLGARTVTLTG
jgi:Flp pilus assembly protein TadG